MKSQRKFLQGFVNIIQGTRQWINKRELINAHWDAEKYLARTATKYGKPRAFKFFHGKGSNHVQYRAKTEK